MEISYDLTYKELIWDRERVKCHKCGNTFLYPHLLENHQCFHPIRKTVPQNQNIGGGKHEG